MNVVKVRRVGNSNVVTLPAGLEELGFAAGADAVIEPQADGSLRVVAINLREQVAMLAKKAVRDNRKALAILKAHDRAGAAVGSAKK